MKRRTLLLLPLLTACAGLPDDVAGPVLTPTAAPQPAPDVQGALADRFIVVFRDDVADPDALTDALARQFGATVHFRYAHALKGFAATLPAAAVTGIQGNPMVRWVEADGIASISGTDTPAASWGLDRVDQRNLPLSNSYTWNQTGANVTAYIIDTGIRMSHNDFGGRASFGYDAIGDGQNGNDCHGHGTHVAGTVGGSLYGIAKSVSLKAVRVLNCQGSGTWSQVIAGIDWVRNNAVKPAVANMSLGGGYSLSINTAVSNAVNSGVTFAVAAGNSSANACNYSPASTATALTVGATTSSDARASYSNYGTCVDLFAPGSGITSAWNSSNTATNTISGTSMASPHVAGVAAIVLSANAQATPAQVETAIECGATTGKVTSAGTGSPNLLLYSLVPIDCGSPPPPSGGFTLAATGYKVKGLQKVNLTWSGASAAVDIWRDGVEIVTDSPNDGAQTDHIDRRGGGQYTYRVCHTGGTSTCSNYVTVTF